MSRSDNVKSADRRLQHQTKRKRAIGAILVFIFIFLNVHRNIHGNLHVDSQRAEDKTSLLLEQLHSKTSRTLQRPKLNVGIPKITRSGVTREGDPKPLFILHPGIPKTATTSIQKGLKKLRYALGKDNYVFPGMFDVGKYNPKALDQLQDRDCQNELSQFDSNFTRATCWNQFVTELDRLYASKTNVIISDERFGELWKSASKPRFHGPSAIAALKDWDVHVLLTYRRWVDWLPSVKSQYDFFRVGGQGKWPDDEKDGKIIHGLFPGLEPIITKDLVGTGRYKNIEMMKDAFEGFFPNRTLLWDLASSEKDVVPTLLCDILPVTRKACNASLHSEIPRANTRRNYKYYRIVCEAAKLGVLNTTLMTPKQASKRLKEFHEVQLKLTDSDFPMICPNRTTLESFLESSLALESRVFPALFESERGEIAHRNDFWKHVQQGKYCSVDVNAAVRNQTYRDFFARLSQ